MLDLKLKRTRTEKDKHARLEFPQSEFIPYRCHWNDHTILTKNDEMLQVIKISGFSFETADDEDIDIRKNIRNLLLKSIAGGSFTLTFHTVRRKQPLFHEDDAMPEMPCYFANYMEEQWRKKNLRKETYVNELYMTVMRRQNKQGVAFIEAWMKKFQQKADKTAWDSDMREVYEDLEEMVGRITTTLRDYSPKVLGVKKRDGIHYSELMEFLGQVVNCGARSPMLVPTLDISRYLPTSRLYFGGRAIELKGPTKSRFAGIISIKEYGQQTAATMMDSFLQLPFEFIITQSFSFIDRQVAIGSMKIQQNRMIQSEDVAVSQIHEISAALDMAMSGRIGFGKHHMSILCIEDTPKLLENALSMASTELGNAGITPVREVTNLEPAYWAQLPGNEDYIARKATINTLNLSSLFSMHNYPTGQKEGNHWGEHVTVLDSTSGTPFYFNFHVRDVGHTTIIGPTGAGKTVLMNFLCAQAQKFNCRTFFFDKDRGAEIFLRAIDGRYSIIDPGKVCGFNPFQLDDTGENRTFLLEFLKILVSTNGENVDSADITKLSDAVKGNFKLDKQDRNLSNIIPFLGIGGDGSLASRIEMWHGNGSHAKLFDNKNDVLDFSQASVFGFEMAELLKDSASLSPVLFYLFHKINISLDGTPTMIVLDEAWALIDNPVFAPKIKDWLKVLRKLNCFVIFATQSVEDASKSSISDTLIQQTATQIFLPNLKATEVYRTNFMLSEREYLLIKTTDPGTRFFIIKQGTDAVVARVDLSGMDDVINVLSGRAETVRLLDKIRAETGDEPEKWLPIFWKKVKDV